LKTGKIIAPNSVRGARRVACIERLHKREMLTDRQYNIAIELWQAAQGEKRQDPLAAVLDRVDRDLSPPEPGARMYDARRKFHRMWSFVPAQSRFVLEHVVLKDLSIESLPTSGSAVALDRLHRLLADGLEAIAEGWDGI
jgi:hypothetical protein